MKTIFCITVAFGASLTAFAQNFNTADLAGVWKMRMDINAGGGVRGEGDDDPITTCLLSIIPKDDGSFDGEFIECGYQKYITGNLYNGKLMNAVLYANEGDKYVYSGRVQDGKLIGTYFTPSCLYGDFEWEKVASPATAAAETPTEPTPAEPTENTETATAETPVAYKTVTRRVTKTVPVSSTRAYDPSLPLATTEVPTGNYIMVGNLDSVATTTVTEYVTERVIATPPVTQKTPPVTATEYKTTTKRAAPAKPQFTHCDAGTYNPNAPHITQVEPGQKVVQNGTTYHIVGLGETMYAITNRYGITIKQLAAWNDKPCEHLKQGEKLRVSAK